MNTSPRLCYHCNKPGHISTYCYSNPKSLNYQGEGQSNNHLSGGQSSQNNQGFSQQGHGGHGQGFRDQGCGGCGGGQLNACLADDKQTPYEDSGQQQPEYNKNNYGNSNGTYQSEESVSRIFESELPNVHNTTSVQKVSLFRIMDIADHIFESVSEHYNKFLDEDLDPISDERALAASSMNEIWNIDSGTMTHCTGSWPAFESLDTSYQGVLGTASTSKNIVGEGTIKISLENSPPARLGGIKMVPGMRGNLLSTQVLRVNGIFNEHGPNGYIFFRVVGGKKVILARSIDIRLNSYLSWVHSPNALWTDPVKTHQLLANQALDLNIHSGGSKPSNGLLNSNEPPQPN